MAQDVVATMQHANTPAATTPVTPRSNVARNSPYGGVPGGGHTAPNPAVNTGGSMESHQFQPPVSPPSSASTFYEDLSVAEDHIARLRAMRAQLSKMTVELATAEAELVFELARSNEGS